MCWSLLEMTFGRPTWETTVCSTLGGRRRSFPCYGSNINWTCSEIGARLGSLLLISYGLCYLLIWVRISRLVVAIVLPLGDWWCVWVSGLGCIGFLHGWLLSRCYLIKFWGFALLSKTGKEIVETNSARKDMKTLKFGWFFWGREGNLWWEQIYLFISGRGTLKKEGMKKIFIF